MKATIFNIIVIVVRTIVIQCDNSDKNTEDSEKRYHSSRGEDSKFCGISPNKTCRTLLFLLDSYYQSSSAGDRLKIITDTDLHIKGPLLDERGWIRSSNMSFASETQNENVTVSLHLDSVVLFQCSWTLNNINLVVTKSDLSSSSFILDSANNEGRVLVENSTVGTISTGSGFRVSIIDSHIDGSKRPHRTLVKVESSNVSLINSTFSNNYSLNQTIIIEGVFGSVVSITDCTFRNNTGSGSLIQFQNDTTIHISNSRFFSNVIIEDGSTLLNVLGNSSATVSDSKFEENFAPAGGIMRLIDSTASVTSSLFLNNTAFMDGVYYMRHAVLSSTDSGYTGNIASSKVARMKYQLPSYCIVKCKTTCQIHGPCLDKLSTAGVIFAKDESVITTVNDTYAENMAELSGSVMFLEQVTLKMVNSSVLKTFSASSSAIFGSKCNVTMVASTFAKNTGHGILYLSGSELHSMRCVFTENSATYGFLLSVSGGSVVIHHNVIAKNINMQTQYPFLLANGSSVIVIGSFFYLNTKGIICNYGSLTVENSVFKNTEESMLSTQYSNVSLFQSNFTGSQGTIAVTKHYFNAGIVSIIACVFSNSTAKSIILLGNSDVSIRDCVFEGNVARQLIAIIQGVLSLGFSKLANNFALDSLVGVIQSEINLQRLILLNNTRLTILYMIKSTGKARVLEVSRCPASSSNCGYLMILRNSSHLDVQDSTFSYNLNIIEMRERSTSSFTNSTFLQNRCNSLHCANLVEISEGSKIHFYYCHFEKNGFPEQDCVIFNSASGEVVVDQSKFIQNMATIIQSRESTIEARSTVFALNATFFRLHISFIRSYFFAKNNTIVSSEQFQQVIFHSSQSFIVLESSVFNFTLPLTDKDFSSVNVIIYVDGGELVLYHCKMLTSSKGDSFDSEAVQFISSDSTLKLRNTTIRTTLTTFTNISLNFVKSLSDSSSNYYTWKTSFVSSSEFVNSTDNPNFLQDASSHKFISGEQNVQHHETVFASGHPTSCSKSCLCRYDVRNRVNIMNCSTGDRSHIPTIEPKTDWLVVANANLGKLCHDDGFDNITSFVLKRNNITSMCDKFGENLDKIGLSHIDLSENALTRIPRSFKELKHVQTLLLSKNRYICDCTVLWMVDWLVNFTTASGKKIVEDYANVMCRSGQKIGTPIYLLDSGKMGCYPDKIASWKIAVIALVGIVLVATVIVATIIIKRSKEARWLIYKNFNKLIQVEEQEDIAGYEFDAFVSYSNHDIELMRDIMMVENSLSPYLETQHRFMLCLHNRNFLGGITIISNIANAIETSRRAVMILTKNFIHAPWCMEEFYLSHHKVMNGKPNYLIPVLMEELEMDQLPRDLQTYLRTHTYIDGREFDLETLRKRIRFSMPDIPLSQLRRRQKIKAGEIREDDLEMEPNDDGMEAVRMLQADGSILEVLHRTRNRPNNRTSLDSSESDDDDSITFGSDTDTAHSNDSNA